MDIFCDGSGNNGRGISGYCVIAKHVGHDAVEHKVFDRPFTNNEMEWHAMNRAIALASPGDIIHSDSQLVVNQVLRRWKINEPRLLEFAKRAWTLLNETSGIQIKWVPREQNEAGIYLENIDPELIEAARSQLPPELLPATGTGVAQGENRASPANRNSLLAGLAAHFYTIGDEIARGNLAILKKEKDFLLRILDQDEPFHGEGPQNGN